jgi:hypothetical protein
LSEKEHALLENGLRRHVIQGEEIFERYQFKKLIGEGASSKVFLADNFPKPQQDSIALNY